jgi:hypothetical protein
MAGLRGKRGHSEPLPLNRVDQRIKKASDMDGQSGSQDAAF